MRTLQSRFSIGMFLVLMLVFSLTACPGQTQEQLRFGADADYFVGLKLLEQKNEKEARLKFNHCIKKGTFYCARKSAQALCTFGNLQEKNEAALALVQQYNDDESLLIAARQLYSTNEMNHVLELTKDLDFASPNANAELAKLRLETMKAQKDVSENSMVLYRWARSYEDCVYKWFTSCPTTREHYQFYRDTYEHPDFDAEEVTYTPRQFAINYRIELYKRNYTYGFQNAPKIFAFFEEKELEPNAMLASDTGKACLYGSMNFAANAAQFKKLAQQYAGTPTEYYFWFYAGRLYDKAGVYFSQSKNCFEQAMLCAQTPDQKDNALWYLLNTSLNFSVDTIIDSIEKYAHEWNNAEYFEDFFESLISSLLASGRWDTFRQIYTQTDGFASDDTVAQYAYIYGRLAQEGYAQGTPADIEAAFRRACRSGSSVYYKVLSAYQLGLTGDELEAVLCSPYAQNEPKIDQAACNLLEGYVAFGFPKLIYPSWLALCDKGIPEETCFYLSDFLAKCSEPENDFATQALRIAARGQKMACRQLKKEEIKQIYPTHYAEFVETSCKKYDIKESVIYALIRSESFFDADVTSTAGAVGLTQLMEFTGSDIAQRLRLKEYSLTDPKTNILFGTYYLTELVRRCDGSLLQGFFSYNAGITRVRRWLKSSMIEFGKKSTMPLDLYLETVPYTETREYGRKLIAATAMYEWLNSDEPAAFANIIETLIE